MKCTIPEISWHNREPVLSVDINPISSETYRLATSGGDSHVLIWHMSLSDNGAVKQELVTDLTRHQRAVNVVRWSPSGLYLASADDDANIIIWQQKTDNIPLLEGDTGDKEIWITCKVLRGHKEDIYDLCWSVDSLKLFSGSIDNTAILWDLSKGKMDHILSDHKGFVQGVAWDPKDQFIASISTDRVCRVFTTNGKSVKARIHKGYLPVTPDHYLHKKEVKYFHDDTFKSFFRRLEFSPEGSLLVVPSGHIVTDDCKKALNATLVFTMDNLNEPAAILPLKNQCSTAVRFCPLLFELHEDGPKPIVNLPYRMIFAVSTDHDVVLYDTQQKTPFARFQEIHYTRLTDLTWSNDGRLLVASSTDGFCALITFDVYELGMPYMKEESEVEESVMDISGCEELEEAGTSAESNEKKRPSFIEQWTIKTPKKIKLDLENKKPEVEEVGDIIEIIDDDVEELSHEIREEINKLIPRRATSKVEDKPSDKSVARPIAVRRKPKPRDPSSNDFKENTPISNHVILTEELQSSDNQEEKEVCREKPEETTVKDTEDIKSSADKKVMKPTKAKKRDTKAEAPKIKVTSLIKKPTPPKNNSLFKFLKGTTGKSKKTAKKGTLSSVAPTLAEEEARDAWKCEKQDVKSKSTCNDKSSNKEPMEEDCTEDFCLQLEDTQESQIKDSESKSTQIGNDKKLDNGMDSHGNSSQAKVIEISDDSNDSANKVLTKKDNVEQKVPRRVALITLSSPKGKKKQKS